MPSPSPPESNTSLTYTQPSTAPHLIHTPIPQPGPKDILVQTKAAAINPVDIQFWGNPVLGWIAGKKEKGIGRDYSGEIVALGEDVKKTGKWEVGDEVYGLCNRPVCTILVLRHQKRAPRFSTYDRSSAKGGGARTDIIPDRRRHIHPLTPADPIARKPDSLSHAAAAAIPLVVLTA